MADLKLGVGLKAIFVLAATVIVLAGLKWGEALIVPLLVAACVAAATAPIVDWLRRRGLPTFVAVTLTIFLVLGGLVGFRALVAVAASDLSNSLPRLERSLFDAKHDLVAWLTQNRLSRVAPMVMSFDPGKLTEHLLAGAVMAVPNALSSFGVVLFIVIFILLEAATFRTKLSIALHWQAERFGDVRNPFGIQKYLLVKTWISAGMGVLCGTWCVVLGLDNAVLWGLVTFLLNFIPVFGPIIATIGPVVTAFLQLGAVPAIAILAGLLLVHNLLGNLVKPKVLGRALGLSPLVITLAMVVWGWLLGPIGALLSVPLTMVVKIVFANTDDLRWAAVLLGPGEGREEQEYAEQRRKTRLSRSLPGGARSLVEPSAPATAPAPPVSLPAES